MMLLAAIRSRVDEGLGKSDDLDITSCASNCFFWFFRLTGNKFYHSFFPDKEDYLSFEILVSRFFIERGNVRSMQNKRAISGFTLFGQPLCSSILASAFAV
ncbi:MAG: hypothetical protein HXY24_10545 [Rubrivivax sp.]|nr:hypothetical protein [Rubrivivax sp.]